MILDCWAHLETHLSVLHNRLSMYWKTSASRLSLNSIDEENSFPQLG